MSAMGKLLETALIAALLPAGARAQQTDEADEIETSVAGALAAVRPGWQY